MSSYTRDAMIAFVIALAAVVIVLGLVFFATKDSAKKEVTKQTRINACKSIESEALRTMCITGSN